MTAPDLSPEAVDRLAWRIHESKADREVRTDALVTLRALSAENERLRAALLPFASLAAKYDPPEDDDGDVCWMTTPKLGELRVARATLEASHDRA